MDWENKYKFKLLIIGSGFVGKTSLILCYKGYDFSDKTPKVAFDALIKTTQACGAEVTLCLWDTQGHGRLRYFPPSYYRGADSIILVFDLTNVASFQNIGRLLKDARDHAPDDCLFVLVGNKADMVDKRAVARDTASSFAESIGVQYIETSAKTSQNVEATFRPIAETLVRKRQESDLLAESVHISQERLDKDRCFGGVTPPTI